ncbi:MAG: hypothetical protein OXL38_02620 [Gammaproteobacteria bacterium]|nr:hypothetical protein [Gammaproteobacteria bacterium]
MPEPKSVEADVGRFRSVFGELSGEVVRQARIAGAFVWRHALRLSRHGVEATRPLEVLLRAIGLAVAAFAPLWPLFGSPPDGWWDWILSTVANVAIGFALFGGGEIVRKIDEVHRAIVASREPAANDEEPTR